MGFWVCLDWNTGNVQYETEWMNKGAMVYADNMLYVYEEKAGTLGLIRPNPEKLEVVSSVVPAGGSGPHWAHPFIHNGKLFQRHGNRLFVFDIKNR